jgi:hypothetical protein
MRKTKLNIIEVLDDDQLLGAALKSPETFSTWRCVLKSLFGLEMTPDELELYRAYTGRQNAPTKPAQVLTLVAGRRKIVLHGPGSRLYGLVSRLAHS